MNLIKCELILALGLVCLGVAHSVSELGRFRHQTDFHKLEKIINKNISTKVPSEVLEEVRSKEFPLTVQHLHKFDFGPSESIEALMALHDVDKCDTQLVNSIEYVQMGTNLPFVAKRMVDQIADSGLERALKVCDSFINNDFERLNNWLELNEKLNRNYEQSATRASPEDDMRLIREKMGSMVGAIKKASQALVSLAETPEDNCEQAFETIVYTGRKRNDRNNRVDVLISKLVGKLMPSCELYIERRVNELEQLVNKAIVGPIYKMYRFEPIFFEDEYQHGGRIVHDISNSYLIDQNVTSDYPTNLKLSYDFSNLTNYNPDTDGDPVPIFKEHMIKPCEHLAQITGPFFDDMYSLMRSAYFKKLDLLQFMDRRSKDFKISLNYHKMCRRLIDLDKEPYGRCGYNGHKVLFKRFLYPDQYEENYRQRERPKF